MKKLPSPSKLVDILYALVEVVRWFLQRKKEHDKQEAVQKSVETGDQAPVEAEFNGDSEVVYRPTRSDLNGVVRSRPAKNRKTNSGLGD